MESNPPNPARKLPRKHKAKTRESKKNELVAWIGRNNPREIGEPEWQVLLRLLAPVSESYLRRLLRDSGVTLTPLVEGVRQESFDALESSLLKLLAEYESGGAAVRGRVRRLVIAAKDHARWASRKEEFRAAKEEMALWMLTWLENPPVFPEWVRLRRTAMGGD
jgi:hypothetical protein